MLWINVWWKKDRPENIIENYDHLRANLSDFVHNWDYNEGNISNMNQPNFITEHVL